MGWSCIINYRWANYIFKKLTQAINGTSTTYGYNAAGNLITEQKSGTTRTYAYYDSQRLASVTEGSTTLGQHTYDAMGRRTKKVAGEITTLYVYDQNGQLIAEYDGDGAWQKDYVYLNGQPLTMIVAATPENVYYYHNDHLGTPQMMTDSTGAGRVEGTSYNDPVKRKVKARKTSFVLTR